MRFVMLGLAVIIVGCNVFPTFITQPDGLNIIPGGIANTSPFFGSFKLAASDSSAASPLGVFMLASCGCGDWRVLLRSTDGTTQRQFPVQFYSLGEYKTTGVVTVYGESEGELVSAQLDQDAGLVMGRSTNTFGNTDVAALRGSAHDQEVDACGYCHLGDDPIWPLPPQHPPKYKTNPRVCFECHSVNGQ